VLGELVTGATLDTWARLADEVFGLKDACVFRRGIVVGRYAEEGGFEMLLRNNAPDYLSLRPFFFGFLVWQLKRGKETMQVSH
jgi:hypothetical protein